MALESLRDEIEALGDIAEDDLRHGLVLHGLVPHISACIVRSARLGTLHTAQLGMPSFGMCRRASLDLLIGLVSGSFIAFLGRRLPPHGLQRERQVQ